MKLTILTSLLIAIGLLSSTSHAGVDNDIPSCYIASKLVAPAQPVHELFVIVDQTTTFDDKLQSVIRRNVGGFIKPGTAFVIADFSSFSQGRYVEVSSAGTLEPLIDDEARADIGVKLLRNFDACMQGQAKFGMKTAANALNSALSESSSDLAKSDVLASLKELSGRVRKSDARNKVVLIASDMLENSSITSFYTKNTVRQINPEKELKLVADNQMFGDFGGARIYVIGAGLLAEDAKQAKGVYRSSQTMQALSSFWNTWFQKSNAELVEFGQPALLNPIH